MSAYYVLLDVGQTKHGNCARVAGIFTQQSLAEEHLHHYENQKPRDWPGARYFAIHKVEVLDTLMPWMK